MNQKLFCQSQLHFECPDSQQIPTTILPVLTIATQDRKTGSFLSRKMTPVFSDQFHGMKVDTTPTNVSPLSVFLSLWFSLSLLPHLLASTAASLWFSGFSGDFAQSFFNSCFNCDNRKFGFSCFNIGRFFSSNARYAAFIRFSGCMSTSTSRTLEDIKTYLHKM